MGGENSRLIFFFRLNSRRMELVGRFFGKENVRVGCEILSGLGKGVGIRDGSRVNKSGFF